MPTISTQGCERRWAPTPRGRIAAGLAVFAWFAVPWLWGCADHTTEGGALTPVEEWTTEPVYEFGDRFEGEAVFGSVSDVDVLSTAEGSRIYVLDARAAEVTIWTPDGTLIQRVGRAGPGPGEFTRPRQLVLLEDRFYVADERRFTTFALDGEVIRTDAPPPMSWRGFPFWIEAMFNDGSFVVTPVVPTRTMAGSMGDDPLDVIPALRVSQRGASWALDTLALVCAVERRAFLAGANPARQLSLQPVAARAVCGGNDMS